MIVTEYPDLLSEYTRFEGLLKDIYGSKNKKEIFLLTTALRAKITQIRDCDIFDEDTEAKIYNMITRLSRDYGLDDKSAAWVTIAWSIGFDLITEAEYDSICSGNRSERYLMLSNYVANMKEYIQQGERSQCSPIANLLIVDASDINQLYENGIILHNQGRFEEALACYDKALAIDPLNSNILSNKGLSLHNQGRFEEALACYDKALAIDPQDEFIIKRSNNTREILHDSNSNATSSQFIGQVSNLNNGSKKSMNLYFLGMAIAAVFLTTGIAAYVIFGSDSNLEANLLGNNSQLTNDVSMNNIDLVNDGSESPSSISHKESISDFTNNIEEEFNLVINSENKSLLQNVNKSEYDSASGNSQSYITEFDGLNGVNQKVDNFKTELGKAMKSNFS
jgi:tetratricopeptide (TPR) repeat protein